MLILAFDLQTGSRITKQINLETDAQNINSKIGLVLWLTIKDCIHFLWTGAGGSLNSMMWWMEKEESGLGRKKNFILLMYMK